MPAPPLANTFEGGSNGTQITTGNSGGGSGDAFTGIVDPSSILSYDSAIAQGTLSAKSTQGGTAAQSVVIWSSLGSITGDFFVRAYVYLDNAAPPSTNQVFIEANTSGATQSFRVYLHNTGFLRITNSANATLVTQNTEYNTQAWFRIEAKVNTGSGAWELRLFNDPDSSSPSDTDSGSGASLGTNVNSIEFGVDPGLANYTFRWDNVAVGTSDWLGPVAGGIVKTGSGALGP